MTGRASRPVTTRAQWLLWLALTVASFGGIAAIISQVSPFTWAHVPLTTHPWVLPLRMQWMPLVGVLALASPLIAIAALFFRVWRIPAFALIGLCATLQFAYVGLEMYWEAQERAGTFAQDDFLTGTKKLEEGKP
jgi:hypothetical protein